ncbi:hypothetical protein N0V95_009822, partial [Ascochyta clinopodiicola]
MSRLATTARILLLLHGLVNIIQGLYSITSPRAWASLAGPHFSDAPDTAVQAI